MWVDVWIMFSLRFNSDRVGRERKQSTGKNSFPIIPSPSLLSVPSLCPSGLRVAVWFKKKKSSHIALAVMASNTVASKSMEPVLDFAAVSTLSIKGSGGHSIFLLPAERNGEARTWISFQLPPHTHLHIYTHTLMYWHRCTHGKYLQHQCSYP